jgi:pimeloyl-ACP methyl ester carboxylesterase
VQRPGVQYALVGDDSVAYSVFGRGDTNVVFLNTLMASIDAMWEHPAHMRNWRMFDEELRIAALDHRGFGVSDPIDAKLLGNIDERIKDVLAVADAVEMPTFGVIAELEQTELAVRLALD